MSHPTAACVRGSSRDSALPVNGPLGARFSGRAEPRVHSRTLPQTVALLAFLSVSPTVRLSALQCPDGSAPPCRVARADPGRKPGVASNTVAVLYFDDLSRDTADAYLADGLTEEITDRLGAIERLQVKSRTWVRRLQLGTRDDPAALARALRVRYVVEGSVRRAGSRVRVSARLVRTTDGFRVWGADYEQTVVDLLALQADIARAVATAIAGTLVPAERAALAGRPTRSPAANERFLRGNYYFAQRTPAAYTRALAEYQAAARVDPGFAEAFVGIARCYEGFLYGGYPGAQSESLLASAQASVREALRLDSTSSNAWRTEARILTYQNPRTYAGVLPAIERAIALNPRNADAHAAHGHLLLELGADSAAAAAYHEALSLEPERAQALIALGDISFRQRRYREALRWADSALMIDPGYYWAHYSRAVFQMLLGDTAEARREAETGIRLSGGDTRQGEQVLARLDWWAGDTVRARARTERIVREVVSLDSGAQVWTVDAGLRAADVLIITGDNDRALDVLERIRPRGVYLAFALQYPGYDPLRAHPRFQRLVEESRPK